jgi:hypothetical protein
MWTCSLSILKMWPMEKKTRIRRVEFMWLNEVCLQRIYAKGLFPCSAVMVPVHGAAYRERARVDLSIWPGQVNRPQSYFDGMTGNHQTSRNRFVHIC